MLRVVGNISNKVLLISFIVTVIIMMLVISYRGYLSEEQTLHRIINEKGYTLINSERGISFELPVREEWIPGEEGEEIINMEISQLHDTQIFLRKVLLRGDIVTFDFEAVTKTAKNRNSGEFLYIDEILRKGSSVSVSQSSGWNFYDENGVDLMYSSRAIEGYSAGEGPGNLFSVSLEKKHIKQIQGGLTIKFTGFVLYKYSKKR